MAEININSRIIHKHDIEANWLNKTFIPNKGEIIVYDIDANYNYERFKIGDGKTSVTALPFANGASQDYVDAELKTLSDEVSVLDQLIGGTAVSEQINNAVDKIVASTFYVTFTKQSGNTYTADKNYAEVEAAYVAGQNVIGLLDTGLETLYHMPIAYYVENYTIAFQTDLEGTVPITVAYGADATIVVQTYDQLASKKYVTSTVAAITHPVTSVNSKTGAVTLTASDVGADASGLADAALVGAKQYTDTEIGEISKLVGSTAVSEQIQTAIADKSDTNHTHYYAGSSGIGGAATSANKLNANAGSTTQPVYFSNGVPVNTTYTLGASVPSDAKFTDTVYTHPTTAGNKHIPSGGSSGQILRWSSSGTAIWGAENNTTYSNATSSSAGLMSAADKQTLDNLDGLVGDKSVTEQINDALATLPNIVVSSDEPANPSAGTLWFQI